MTGRKPSKPEMQHIGPTRTGRWSSHCPAQEPRYKGTVAIVQGRTSVALALALSRIKDLDVEILYLESTPGMNSHRPSMAHWDFSEVEKRVHTQLENKAEIVNGIVGKKR